MTRIFSSDHRETKSRKYPDPFPVEKLKRVDRPTTAIEDDIVKRVDERHGGFHRSGQGEFGTKLQKEYKRFVAKHPLSGALVTMAGALRALVDEPEREFDASGTPWGVSSWKPMPRMDEKIEHNGYERWHTDVEKCTRMRVGNQYGAGCGTCIKVCPWNKPHTAFHRTVGWAMRKLPPLRRLGVWGDDLLGYGKPEGSRKWWLDVHEVDGKFEPAPTRQPRGKL